jgi:hypothetical protein
VASRPKPLARARRTGWRYPIVGDAGAGLGHLRQTRRGLVFAGISEGPLAGRVLHAAAVAETELSDSAHSFELRLLDIPALRIFALWLRARRGPSYFVPLTDQAPEPSGGPRLVKGIETLIGTALASARSRLRHKRGSLVRSRRTARQVARL